MYTQKHTQVEGPFQGKPQGHSRLAGAPAAGVGAEKSLPLFSNGTEIFKGERTASELT